MDQDPTNQYVLLQRGGQPLEALPCPENFSPVSIRRFYEQDQRISPFLDQVLTPLDLRRVRADLYHAPSIYYHCRRLPCASVLTILDLIPLIFPEQYMQTGFKHRMLYRFARKADHILTPSASARKDVHRHLGIPMERITVTPFAADERFRPEKDASRVKDALQRHGIEQPYILYTGGFTKKDPRKNVMQLVEVYRDLRRSGYDRYALVLAGKPGAYSDEIMREMGQGAQEAGVFFPGHLDHDELPLLYNGATCFVYPSIYEGFGMPPLEAMTCGTPTIAYDNSSLPEVLGDAGILIDEGDPKALFEAVRAVLDRDDLAAEMREKGIRQAKRFSWETTARKTLAVYRKVLTGRRGG